MKKQSREAEPEDEKQRREVEAEERRYNCAKVSREKIQWREVLGKSPRGCVFPMICVSAGSKSRLAKAAGAEVAAQSKQEKLHVAVARSTFQVKIHQRPQKRTAF